MTKTKQIKINFSVASYNGDDSYSLLPKQALSKIKKIADEENKWVFIEGEHKKHELITEDELVNAMEEEYDITLVNAIAGGNCMPSKIVEINVDVEKKATDIAIVFDEDDYRKQINIAIGEENIYDLLHDREVIVKALEKKLDELAVSQVVDLRKALNV